MAAMVCRGLQSCLDQSQLVEQRTLRLKLSSPKPNFSQPFEFALKSCFLDSNTKDFSDKFQHDEITNKPNSHYLHENPTTNTITKSSDLGGWTFLQSLSTNTQLPKESMDKKQESNYVHPLVKRSQSTLSEKSLQLCTENLGNETGSDFIDNTLFFSQSQSESAKDGNLQTREQQSKFKSRQLLRGGKVINHQNFPPPLTTIRGIESLSVRPHREDGRLIIEAVKTPTSPSLFLAERSHGRLRLCLLKSSSAGFDPRDVKEENEENEETESRENDNDANEELEVGEEEEEYLEENEEMDRNKMNVGGEMGMELLERSCRCKEGESENHGLRLNWEPYWVATS